MLPPGGRSPRVGDISYTMMFASTGTELSEAWMEEHQVGQSHVEQFAGYETDAPEGERLTHPRRICCIDSA